MAMSLGDEVLTCGFLIGFSALVADVFGCLAVKQSYSWHTSVRSLIVQINSGGTLDFNLIDYFN